MTSKRLVGVVCVFALVAIMLPRSITRRAGGMVQVFAPFQDAASRVVGDVACWLRGGGDDGDSVDGVEVASLRRAVESLTAQNAHLRGEVQMLTRVRGRGLGASGVLIPTRAIADDAGIWRRSKLILGGTRRGFANRDAVVSRMEINLSAREGARNGLAVLSGESLVGMIDHAGTFTSRVRLLNDPATKIPITVGRVQDDAFVGSDAVFWFLGRGDTGIDIRDVHHRYVDDGDIRVGDVVLTLPDDPNLPPSLSIGNVSRIYPDPDNALLYILEVETGIDLAAVRRLYVVDRDAVTGD